MTDVVGKLWGFCHTLRHDGIDYGDYIEQITYLLFLKMAEEREIDLSAIKIKSEDGKTITRDCSWGTLESKSGTALTEHYVDVLRALGKQPGMLGDIFAGAPLAFHEPGQPFSLFNSRQDAKDAKNGMEAQASACARYHSDVAQAEACATIEV